MNYQSELTQLRVQREVVQQELSWLNAQLQEQLLLDEALVQRIDDIKTQLKNELNLY